MDFSIAREFINNYYSLYDSGRDAQMKNLYSADAGLCFEDDEFRGPAAIYDKIKSLPFKTVQHTVTTVDEIMTTDDLLLAVVNGELHTDDDPVYPFNETFLLRHVNDSLFITTQVFRLPIHRG